MLQGDVLHNQFMKEQLLYQWVFCFDLIFN
jgi:hypothetical protein